MHFLKDDKEGLSQSRFSFFSRCLGKLSGIGVNSKPYFPCAFFRGEERGRSVGGLLFVLVVLLHVWAALRLLGAVQPHPKTKPVIIEVSLMAMPSQQAKALPSVPTPAAIAEPPKITKPKITEPKKGSPKKKMPALQKPIGLQKPVVDKPVPTLPQPATESPMPHFETYKPAANSAVPVAKLSPSVAPVAEESERATCVACPTLKFPAIAQRRGWQGSVLLKFELTPEGLAQNITVVRSSGHELLDEAAVDNAKGSRFTTTKAGEIRKVTKSYKFTIKEE